ncbi:MAG: RimK family alpha-L-glutamate ligase [Candidatus Altiarchaeota archaeon]|nr:RimK family alpha-L-glutamate ligase [Candidatus Altiarchaeota archaeon]
MKLAILGPLSRSYEEIRVIEEAAKVFSSTSYFAIPQINVEIRKGNFALTYKNKDLMNYEVIYPRIPRTYKKFGATILSLLQQGGAQLPITPESLVLSHNKFLTLLLLQERDIPVPETYMAVKRETLEHALEKLDYPLVMKLIYGSKGAGVMFADSKQSAVSVMDALERFNEPIFVEEFIKNKGEDVRLYIVGGRVISSMKRVAKEGEMRSNIGIGGVGEKYEPTHEEKRMALKSAKVLEMDICGIDIMHGPNGPVVIEANVNAQFQGLEKADSKNVAGEIVKYLRRQGAFWRS